MHSVTQTNLGGGGRLGNTLFGVAAIYGTAWKLGLTPKIPLWKYRKYFATQYDFLEEETTHVYHEPYFHYTPVDLGQCMTKLEAANKVYDLHGYYQSPKYWEGYEEQIKELFKLTDEWEKRIKHLWNAMGLEPFNSIGVYEYCSIHIRRGDYVNNSFYTDLTATDYYEKAIEYIKSNTNTTYFLVFSDDIPFCQTFLLHRSDCLFVDLNSDIEDLFLMSKCSHNIIANSSFSWWSAYLNSNPDKVVVAPNKWFGDNVNFNTNDLIPKEWVRL